MVELRPGGASPSVFRRGLPNRGHHIVLQLHKKVTGIGSGAAMAAAMKII